MKQPPLVFVTLIFLFVLIQNIFGQTLKSNSRNSHYYKKLVKPNFSKGISLGKYYSLDSVRSITVHNWKGEHKLTKKQQQSFVLELKSYVFDGDYAHTKPGHLWCWLTFLNGSSLYFDINSEFEVIISNEEMGDNTFVTKVKTNFEKY